MEPSGSIYSMVDTFDALAHPARRALLEAAARREPSEPASGAGEHGGPSGPEPTRYGDWEKKGLAIDF